MKQKILMSWSGGKDSSIALYELARTGQYEVAALLTTITETYDRISMHGVRRILLEQQAEALGLPLEKVLISKSSTDEEYETKMRSLLERYTSQGISGVAFGDIFLEDLKKYREGNLASIGLQGLFPIWKRNTCELARTFIDLGFEAITTCVDSQTLTQEFVGRRFDNKFLNDLPPGVDPCGENGEFHSFVYDGPLFKRRIPCAKGEIVLRDNRFYFCDLVPDEPGQVSLWNGHVGSGNRP